MKKQLFILILVLLMVCSCFTACGDDADLKGIIMKTQPTKTEYLVGDTFDPAGATVELTYSDGKTVTKELTAEMLPASLTFTEAGYFQLPVTYVENGITKTTIISVKVSDPSTSGQMTGLAAAQADATAILTAYYNKMVFTAPANYPAAPEKLATDAKAVFDAAIAAFANAADSAAVYELLGKAQADLNALDNYIDWYAAEKVSALEKTFETEYTNNKKFIEDYNDKLVVFKRQIARILRSDNLAEIDSLVEGLDNELENAKNILNDLIEKLLKYTWVFDLSPDPAKDDANLVNYKEIEEIMLAVPETDILYQLELMGRLSTVEKDIVDVLKPATGIHTNYQTAVLDPNYNATADTYDLYTVLMMTSMRMEELLEAREEADRPADDPDGPGIEAIIAEAMKGYEYGAIAANSPRHQALKDAYDVFMQWVANYNIDEVNEDLVANAKDLKWLLDILDNIIGVYGEDEWKLAIPEITGIPTQIIYKNTGVIGALDAAKVVITEFETKWAEYVADTDNQKGVPAWGSVIDPTTGDQVYLIKNYDQYAAAAERYAQLDKAAAEVVKEGGLVGLIAAIKAPIVLTSNATIDPAMTALATLQKDYLLDVANYNFVFESLTITEAQTEDTAKANLSAILGGEYTISWPLAAAKGTDETVDGYNYLLKTDARYDTLLAAKAEAALAGGLVETIKAEITSADWLQNKVTLDSKATLDAIKATYEQWVADYKIDEPNDKGALWEDGVYTIYEEGQKEYADLVQKVTDLKAAINAVDGPITVNSQGTVSGLRAQFNALATANSEKLANKSTTYKHLDAEYQELCEMEAKLFAIRYASLVQSTYEKNLKAMRDDYTALIGGETLRAEDNNALGVALAIVLDDLHALESTYDVDYFKNEIYQNGASAEWVFEEGKQEGVVYDLYDEVVAELDALCDGAEASFKVAARYIVTEADGAYTLTIYVGGDYVAKDILSAKGTKVDSYKAIVIDALVGAGNVTLTGFVADDVVIGAPAVTTFALATPTVTIKGATEIANLTVNTACTVVIEDNAADTAAVAAVEVKATATIINNDVAKIEVVAVDAPVVIEAKGDVALSTNAPAEVTTEAHADVTTTADITVKAETITAKVQAPEVAEGETPVVPTVSMNAAGKVDVSVSEGIKTDDIKSESNEVVIKQYIGDNFGDGDDSTDDDNWTGIY